MGGKDVRSAIVFISCLRITLLRWLVARTRIYTNILQYYIYIWLIAAQNLYIYREITRVVIALKSRLLHNYNLYIYICYRWTEIFQKSETLHIIMFPCRFMYIKIYKKLRIMFRVRITFFHHFTYVRIDDTFF